MIRGNKVSSLDGIHNKALKLDHFVNTFKACLMERFPAQWEKNCVASQNH